MTRDESTEGWLPLAGGGLANVSIRKRARLPPDVGGHEYIIYGQRISDQTVCTIHSKWEVEYSVKNNILVFGFTGDSQLCHKRWFAVFQSDANLSSLACW